MAELSVNVTEFWFFERLLFISHVGWILINFINFFRIFWKLTGSINSKKISPHEFSNNVTRTADAESDGFISDSWTSRAAIWTASLGLLVCLLARQRRQVSRPRHVAAQLKEGRRDHHASSAAKFATETGERMRQAVPHCNFLFADGWQDGSLPRRTGNHDMFRVQLSSHSVTHRIENV
jgi:hypothetical protein